MHWKKRFMRRPAMDEPGHVHELTFTCFHSYAFLRSERTCARTHSTLGVRRFGEDASSVVDEGYLPAIMARSLKVRRVFGSTLRHGHPARLATDEETAVANEANRDEWEHPSGKKKRHSWRRGQ